MLVHKYFLGPNGTRSSTSPTLDFLLPPRFDEVESDEIISGNIIQSSASNSLTQNGRRNISTTAATPSSSSSTVFNSTSLTSTLNSGGAIAAASSSSFDSSDREMRLLRRNHRAGHRQRIPDSLRFRDRMKIRSTESQARQGSSTPTGVIINSNDTTIESAMDNNDDDFGEITAEMDETDREFDTLQHELIEESILLGAAAVTNDNLSMNSQDIREMNVNEDDNMSEDSGDDSNDNHRVLI